MNDGLFMADEILRETEGRFSRMEAVHFMALLGVMLDTWCAVNHEDSVSILEHLLRVNKQVNEELGPMVM